MSAKITNGLLISETKSHRRLTSLNNVSKIVSEMLQNLLALMLNANRKWANTYWLSTGGVPSLYIAEIRWYNLPKLLLLIKKCTLMSLNLGSLEEEAIRQWISWQCQGKLISMLDIKACRGMELQLNSFSTSVQDRGEWAALGPGRLTAGFSSLYPLNNRLARPQSRSGRQGGENSLIMTGVEPRCF
jgi:hypothetical protein